MKTAAFFTLGCKVNQSETRRLASELEASGWAVISPSERADIYIVNSCAVTAESSRKTRQTVRRFKKNNPSSIVVLIGCMPSVEKNIQSLLPEADIILTQAEKGSLEEKIRPFLTSESCQTTDDSTRHKGIVRASVKIQDGCDNFCSYCIIPYARGRARSLPASLILDDCRELIKNGAREIVLTGINIGAYSQGGLALSDIARAVGEQPELRRLRLGSLEPDKITQPVMEELSKIPLLCNHFHLSLQSGSDRVLRRMNRHYSSAYFLELCQQLRELFGGCTITTDIITGFPGESEEDFKSTLAIAEKAAFEKVHVFPFSAREGTRAAREPCQIPRAEKEARTQLLIKATAQIRQAYLYSKIGGTLEFLAEEIDSEGAAYGYSREYIPVKLACYGGTIGEEHRVTIKNVEGDFCVA